MLKTAPVSGARDALLDHLNKTHEAARARLDAAQPKGFANAHAYSRLYDALLKDILAGALAAHPGGGALALCATGGFGRGALAPHSDIDLLFLLPGKETGWSRDVVGFVLYMLWDMRLKVGHAVRTARECVRQARGDITINTSLLDARFIAGARAVFDDFAAAFAAEAQKRRAIRAFVEAKLSESHARYARVGASRYQVEPNIKDGKGGLRDLQTLIWIAKYVYGATTGAALSRAGLLTPTEYRRYRVCENTLWTVRRELHLLRGRADERLSFDAQPELAARLGFSDKGALSAVERFMKHYFLTAKDVGDLSRIFSAVLEERHVKKRPALRHVVSALRFREKGFKLEAGRLNISQPRAFLDTPVNLLRLFHIAALGDMRIHPHALSAARRARARITPTLRRETQANRMFLEILTSRHDPGRILRKMNEAGILGRFVPDFGRIVALMQFNMYHHYTADEHLLHAIDLLSALETGKDKVFGDVPFVRDILRRGIDREALYLAVFLHDIAKGRREDHSKAGARVARALCARLKLSRTRADTISWLVENHLDMSHTAQKRDISDPRTVADFAARVGSPARLDLLFLLTIVDIRAVGPGVWNAWKAQLLAQLYDATRTLLESGGVRTDAERLIARRKKTLEDKLASWKPAERRGYIAQHVSAYWRAFPSDVHERHARMSRRLKADTPIVFDARDARGSAGTRIIVLADDHPGLFARLAGAFALGGLEIVDAKIFTARTGVAFDTFLVRDAHTGDAVDARRVKRLEAIVADVLTGRVRPQSAMARIKPPRDPSGVFDVETHVLIDNEASSDCTIVEITAHDRVGLLHELAWRFYSAGLTIVSAQTAQFGARVVDVFYVKDGAGGKLVQKTRQDALRRALLEAAAHKQKKQKRAS